jgi:hypothetical protein
MKVEEIPDRFSGMDASGGMVEEPSREKMLTSSRPLFTRVCWLAESQIPQLKYG